MSEINQRLRIARENAGLSQGQVSQMMNMHRPTISEIEAGRRKISTDELKKFAEIYDVSASWLIDEHRDVDEIDERVRLAARNLSKLNSEDLDKVVRLLSSMKETISK